jgi:hypothetical protein
MLADSGYRVVAPEQAVLGSEHRADAAGHDTPTRRAR